jgi:hypothetical protein
VVDGTLAGLAVGDFNGDGHPDIGVTTDFYVGNLGILLGNGDGTFRGPTYFAVGSLSGAPVVGDFAGAGTLDLAAPSSGSDTLNVLRGNGDGTFQADGD